MSTPAPLSNPGKTSLLDRVSWPDIIAGLSLAGLLLPEAVAYSSIANLPPQAGVIALFAGLVCYGLMGTSRFAIVSATSSSAAVLAAASATMAGPDNGLRLMIAVALVLVTGLFFTFAGLARAGSMSAFIAKPVLRGFAFGLAIVIIFKQVASVVGVHPQHSDLVRFLAELFGEIGQWNWAAGAVALVAWGLLLLFARIPRLPGGLVVIVIGIAAGQWLNLAQYGVGLVGTIDLQLTAPTLPSLSYAQWLRIGELSVAMLLILYAESYGSIRSFAMKYGDNVSPNRDLLALGAANLLSGLFHGMPVGAGYSATSANEAAGATSRLAGWSAALILLIVVLTLLPSIALLPEPVLAAIVVQAVSHTLRPSVFAPNFILHRDRTVVIAAVLAVLALGVMDGLLAAIAVSLVMMLRRMSESSVTILGQLNHGHDFVSRALHPNAQAVSHILILRPDTALFFANAERVLAQIRNYITAAGDTVHTLIISLEESPDLDSSSVEALTEFCTALISEDKHLLFARLKPPVQQVLVRAAIPGLPIETLCALSVDDAVNVAQRLYP
ncbi:SulP family inorganic anion transporter [Pseudomonas sp. CCI3.2]|uniref:SulP family inorganic anion transporter n=1 Tax=unclassified Pseudomonas TaxID=196821 RepID=UPI002AC9EDFC|nr:MULTISPECIES: SulP family inorganic anion transporter [unclassified Pseudomonas]MEB0078317.1 SulP family inorganic anion transporter [Pseudomonas sp. MH10out]MEB0092278.1 SulP family inorganic anion transporter [Pseudomonas sp. CCI4.2]MEB0101771.1 SulP family inorganic anion transporter [Pseudomonas sp. CCI3.2]MEB0132150.1 SulP family inorganic anion transporter [Pseudomonas sp. CCI2.4]MEB0160377.1 SulP family inorganic anion transporter [Pseudomonas sp. AH2 (2023)]